jgi:thioredoxin reductase (NADPH)
MQQKNDNLINSETRKILKDDFSKLKDPVDILVFTSDTENQPFNEFSRKLLDELSRISGKIRPKFEKIGSATAKQHTITRSPTLLIQPDEYGIRMTGAPAGEEAQTLMTSILMVSTKKTFLSESSRKRLAELKGSRSIKVFVSPT